MAEPENLAVFTRWAKYAHAPHPLYDHLLRTGKGKRPPLHAALTKPTSYIRTIQRPRFTWKRR